MGQLQYEFYNNENVIIRFPFKESVFGPKIKGLFDDSVKSNPMGLEYETNAKDSKYSENIYYDRSVKSQMVVRYRSDERVYEKRAEKVIEKRASTNNQIFYLTLAIPFPSADELGEVRKVEVSAVDCLQ